MTADFEAGATQSKPVRAKRSRKANALLLHDVILLSDRTFWASGLCGTSFAPTHHLEASAANEETVPDAVEPEDCTFL